MEGATGSAALGINPRAIRAKPNVHLTHRPSQAQHTGSETAAGNQRQKPHGPKAGNPEAQRQTCGKHSLNISGSNCAGLRHGGVT